MGPHQHFILHVTKTGHFTPLYPSWVPLYCIIVRWRDKKRECWSGFEPDGTTSTFLFLQLTKNSIDHPSVPFVTKYCIVVRCTDKIPSVGVDSNPVGPLQHFYPSHSNHRKFTPLYLSCLSTVLARCKNKKPKCCSGFKPTSTFLSFKFQSQENHPSVPFVSDLLLYNNALYGVKAILSTDFSAWVMLKCNVHYDPFQKYNSNLQGKEVKWFFSDALQHFYSVNSQKQIKSPLCTLRDLVLNKTL